MSLPKIPLRAEVSTDVTGITKSPLPSNCTGVESATPPSLILTLLVNLLALIAISGLKILRMFVTKSVVAILLEESPKVGVGAVGTPVKLGDSLGALLFQVSLSKTVICADLSFICLFKL